MCFEKYIFLCPPLEFSMGIKHTNTWKFQGGLKISRTWKNPGPLEISRAPGNFKVSWKFPGGSLISLRTSSAACPDHQQTPGNSGASVSQVLHSWRICVRRRSFPARRPARHSDRHSQTLPARERRRPKSKPVWASNVPGSVGRGTRTGSEESCQISTITHRAASFPFPAL